MEENKEKRNPNGKVQLIDDNELPEVASADATRGAETEVKDGGKKRGWTNIGIRGTWGKRNGEDVLLVSPEKYQGEHLASIPCDCQLSHFRLIFRMAAGAQCGEANKKLARTSGDVGLTFSLVIRPNNRIRNY